MLKYSSVETWNEIHTWNFTLCFSPCWILSITWDLTLHFSAVRGCVQHETLLYISVCWRLSITFDFTLYMYFSLIELIFYCIFQSPSKAVYNVRSTWQADIDEEERVTTQKNVHTALLGFLVLSVVSRIEK